MMPYLSLHREAAAKALRQLFRQPMGTLLILLMLAIAMTLPLAYIWACKAANRFWVNSMKRPPLPCIWN